MRTAILRNCRARRSTAHHGDDSTQMPIEQQSCNRPSGVAALNILNDPDSWATHLRLTLTGSMVCGRAGVLDDLWRETRHGRSQSPARQTCCDSGNCRDQRRLGVRSFGFTAGLMTQTTAAALLGLALFYATFFYALARVYHFRRADDDVVRVVCVERQPTDPFLWVDNLPKAASGKQPRRVPSLF